MAASGGGRSLTRLFYPAKHALFCLQRPGEARSPSAGSRSPRPRAKAQASLALSLSFGMWQLLWPFKRVCTASKPSSASNAAGLCYIAALPQEVLAVILLLAGEANRPAIRLVCQAWNQALVAAGLWRTFRLEAPALLLAKRPAGNATATAAASAAAAAASAAWLAGKLALLQRTAPHVLVVRSGGAIQALVGGPWLEGCLALLQLAALRSLTLDIRPRLSQRLLKSVLLLRHLAELRLSSGSRLPANTPAVMAGLPSLRSLHLSASRLDDPLLAAVVQLSALTALSLGASRQELFVWAVQHLPALSSLRAVSLVESSSDMHEQAMVQQLLVALPRLGAFEYACCRREGGLQLPGCNRLRMCKFALSSPPAPASAAVELGATGLTSLQHLLAALLPAGTPLRSLTLRRGSTSTAGFGQRCTALSTLQVLAFEGVTCMPSLEAGLEALLHQAPVLADLRLCSRRSARYGRPAALPSAVVQRQGLRKLSLEGPGLCPGPYLSGVRELILLLREGKGVPSCLAGARSLERLALSWRRPHGPLDVVHLASTLAPSNCPQLVTLRLSNCYKLSQQERAVLREKLPQLLEVVGGEERPPAPTLQDWLRAGLSKLVWALQNAY